MTTSRETSRQAPTPVPVAQRGAAGRRAGSFLAALGLVACGLWACDGDDPATPDPTPAATPDGGASDGGTGGPPTSRPLFVFPSLSCRDPKPGEPPGKSAGGKVCTWQTVSAATEEGRHYEDYADCSISISQRGYYPVPPPAPPASDTRMSDPAYAAEAAWVRSQVEATACVCCHKASITKAGASIWDIEAKGNWLNTFTPYGLAFAGGFIDSSLLGAYPKEQNNGFSRDHLGIPSTDPARMARFFENELRFRGKSPADFASEPPTPAYFYLLDSYKPAACKNGAGVKPDGTIVWNGPPSRYVQVLAAGSRNPGVPPNLDLPAGTLWRLDVPVTGAPVAPGTVRYGVLPAGTRQGFPSTGQPAALQPGVTYYLYVQADILGPVERCLFTYSGM
ncbi:MAG: hypothetical protein U1A78_24015 [Polyangia bacterium]